MNTIYFNVGVAYALLRSKIPVNVPEPFCSPSQNARPEALIAHAVSFWSVRKGSITELWLSCSLITVMFLLLCVWLFSAFSFVSVVIVLLLRVLLFIAFSFVSVDKCGNLHFINYCKTNRLSNYCHCIIKIVICDVQATTEKLFPHRRIILQSDHRRNSNS